MKAKKILLLIAGILNTIASVVLVGLSLLVLAFQKLFKTVFTENRDVIDNFINELIKQDPSYEYLKDLSQSEAVDYVLDVVRNAMIVLLIIGVILIVLGILNILLSKRLYILKTKKVLGVLLVVFSWIPIIINPMNILTTIGVFLKPKEEKDNTLYSRSNSPDSGGSTQQPN